MTAPPVATSATDALLPPVPLDVRLALPALAAWLVAWLGARAPVSVLVAAGAALLLVAAALLPGGRRLLAAAVLACCGAASLSTGLHGAARTAGPVPDLAAHGAAVSAEAVLTDDPHRAAAGGPRPLILARVRVDQVRASGHATRVRTPVLVLTSDPTWLGLLPSQRVRLQGRLQPANPGDDVAAVVSVRGPPQVLSPPSRLQRVAGSLREGLRRAVAPLPERERGLLPGLVVGDTSRLGADVQADFRSVGLTHLTAVSGTNVAVVVGAVLLLCRAAGVRVRASPVLAAAALVAFVVLARPSPSVLRAAVMGGVGLLALATGSRRTAMPALAAAVLLLVLVDPSLAGTAGFALSVLATGGLLVLAPGWRERLRCYLPGPLADAIAVPAAAQVACGPIVVAISAQLGLLSIPANLLAIPAVAPATLAGVAAALLAPVWLPAAQAVAWLGWLPTAWLVLVARVGAGLPGAAVPWPDGSTGALLLAAATGALLAVLRRRRLRRLLVAAATGIAVASTALALTAPAWPPPGWLLVACDVGQGDGLVLRVSDSAAVVVDTGPDPPLIDRCLKRLHITSVPLVLLTHLHVDHATGLPGVLRGRQVAQIEIGPTDEPVEQFHAVTTQAAAAGVPVVRGALDEARTVGPLRWEVLGPTHRYRGTRSDPNNSSLVLRLHTGGITVLLTGDMEPEAQRDLLARGVDLTADVLKVPHHGSNHQEPAFLDAVGAALALTSVGAHNTYGHPSPATLQRLRDDGAAVLRTDVGGDLAVVLRHGRLTAVGRG